MVDAAEIEITPEMIDAGASAFTVWFEDPIHAESLLELPGDGDLSALLFAIFRSMRSASPVSRLN